MSHQPDQPYGKLDRKIADLKLAEDEYARLLAEAEEHGARLDALIDAIPNGIIIYKPDGVIVRMNSIAREVLSYTDDQLDVPAERRKLKIRIETEDGQPMPRGSTPFERARRGEIVRDCTLIIRKEGRTHYLSANSAPILSPDGRLIGVVSTFVDITERKLAEEREKRREAEQREFYRRTILAATDGKLNVTDREEICRIAGESAFSRGVDQAQEVGEARHEVRKVADDARMDEDRREKLIVSLGEALTNAYKHAGGGRLSIHRLADGLMAVVSDEGPGIPSPTLPDIAFTRGYSTAGTLGMGFKFMLSMADQVHLATGPEGTTVGLFKRFHPREKPLFGLASLGKMIAVEREESDA